MRAASAPTCSAPPSGQLRHFDNRSVLQSRPPLDVKALIAGRREPFDFASTACRLLHETCTMPPGTGVFGSSRCRGLRVECAAALARRDDCVVVRDACVSLSQDGDLRVDGRTDPAVYNGRSVWKTRDRGRTCGNCAGTCEERCPDRYRLALPRITQVTGRCAGPGTRSLRSATLTSPVWPTNFGETVLGAGFDLVAHTPTDALLLAVSEATVRRWQSKCSFWSELLNITWPSSRLHLLSEKGFFREEASSSAPSALHVEELHVCHMHDVFDDGSRSFQGLQPSLLGEYARHHGHVSRRRPTPTASEGGLRIGIVAPSDNADQRRIHNAEELLSACERHAGALSCEVVHLDAPGVFQNLRTVAPLHAMISLHGANNAYAAFAARPFALLEIKPFPMPLFFFEKYYQTAYALDTWTYGYFPGLEEHRKGRWPGASLARFRHYATQHQACVLPVPVFLEWACNVSRRFREVRELRAKTRERGSVSRSVSVGGGIT